MYRGGVGGLASLARPWGPPGAPRTGRFDVPVRFRFIGPALLLVAAIGLAISVSDALAAAQCIRDSEGLLALCSGPLPVWLYGVWLYVGSLGALVVWRRR